MKKKKQAIRSKETALVVLFILSATLTGALLFKPELINASEPFIDLNSGVGNAIGNAEGAYNALKPSNSSEAQTPAFISTETSMSDHAAIEPNFGDYDIRVVVEGESITKQEKGSTQRTELDIEELLSGFQSAQDSYRDRILLVDDYADAKVFIRIIRAFDAQGIQYDIERTP